MKSPTTCHRTSIIQPRQAESDESIQSRRVTKAGVINAYFNAKLRGIDYDVTKLYYEQLPSLTLQDITNFEKQQFEASHTAWAPR